MLSYQHLLLLSSHLTVPLSTEPPHPEYMCSPPCIHMVKQFFLHKRVVALAVIPGNSPVLVQTHRPDL